MTSEDFETQFAQYRSVQESTETLFTIVVCQHSINELLKALEHRIQLARTLKQSKKKSIVCQRLDQFKEWVSLLDTDLIKQINSIFLISEKIIEMPLEKSWIQTISEYNIETFIFKYSRNFQIDYLKDLLTDFSFRNIILVNNNAYTHFLINSTKKKIQHQKESKYFDLDQYLTQNVKNKCLIHGVSSVLKNFKSDTHWVFTKRLTDDEIFQIFKEDDIQRLHNELDICFAMISNPKTHHRLLFGKDIEKAIFNQSIKTLYCSPEMFSKVMIKVPSNYLTSSFKIHKVESLKSGDSGDLLKSNFSGAIGLTFY